MHSTFKAALNAAKRQHKGGAQFYIVRHTSGQYEVSNAAPASKLVEYWRYELNLRRGRRNWGRDLGPGRYIWERTEFAVFA